MARNIYEGPDYTKKKQEPTDNERFYTAFDQFPQAFFAEPTANEAPTGNGPTGYGAGQVTDENYR